MGNAPRRAVVPVPRATGRLDLSTILNAAFPSEFNSKLQATQGNAAGVVRFCLSSQPHRWQVWLVYAGLTLISRPHF